MLAQNTTHLIQSLLQRRSPCKIQQANEPHEDLVTVLKRRKLQWYGYVFHLSFLLFLLLIYGMEISAEKTKLMTKHHQQKVKGQKLQTVTSFKYLGSVIIDDGSKPEILFRIAQTATALTRLKPVWNDKSISLSSKI